MSELTSRKESILSVVVKDYISTAEPVGSGTISRKYLKNLSSATIRNVMSKLDTDGYLKKPHTSAGRVPTDKGYRFYVDSLNAYSLNKREREFIEKSFPREHHESEDLLQISLGVLSFLTNKTGLVLSPRLNKVLLNRIELIRTSGMYVLVVIVGSSGDVFNKNIQMEEELSQEQLNSISRFLNDKYSGLTIPAIREKVFNEIVNDRKLCDTLVKRALEICSKFFVDSQPDGELYFSGMENFFNQQEFMNDLTSVKEIFKALEKKAVLIMVLDKCLGEEAAVFIGSETKADEIKDCSVIAHSYKCGDQTLGTIGIFGHKRMEYPRIISIVSHTAELLSRKLSEQSL